MSKMISYDSTWEEDDGSAEKERSTNNAKVRKNAQYRYMYSTAARDMQNYRHGYRRSGPSYCIDSENMPNLRFYRNEITFKPAGCYIEYLLNEWKDKYDILEQNHDYIQWLFPLQERGVNRHATPLHKKEIKVMKTEDGVTRRLLEAYKLMLGFYGLHLKNEKTGEVQTAGNWEERSNNLNNHTHNNLRITRILKCLGELGFEHYQAPLVEFFLRKTLCEGQLKNIKRSVLDYFIFSVKDKRKRQDLVRFAWKHYRPQSGFVWGPVDLLRNNQVLKECEGKDCDSIQKEDKPESQRKNSDEINKCKRKARDDREDDVITVEKKNDQNVKEVDNEHVKSKKAAVPWPKRLKNSFLSCIQSKQKE